MGEWWWWWWLLGMAVDARSLWFRGRDSLFVGWMSDGHWTKLRNGTAANGAQTAAVQHRTLDPRNIHIYTRLSHIYRIYSRAEWWVRAKCNMCVFWYYVHMRCRFVMLMIYMGNLIRTFVGLRMFVGVYVCMCSLAAVYDWVAQIVYTLIIVVVCSIFAYKMF